MRSKLFIPGARPDLFAKALAGEADALSLDLEDSVPAESKADARMAVSEFIGSEAATSAAKAIIVQRHPKESTPSCRIGGQIAPATACPEEISATAAPRRRSNQRLT